MSKMSGRKRGFCRELGIKCLVCRTKTPGPGAQSALRALARAGMKIGRIGQNWPDGVVVGIVFLDFCVLCRGRDAYSV